LASRRDLPISAPARLPGDQKSSFIMSVSIRLNRKGTKDRPYYKIVAVDSRKRRDGRYIEQLGTYDPLKEGTNFTIDKWLAVGAKLADKWLPKPSAFPVPSRGSEEFTVNSMIRKARTAACRAGASRDRMPRSGRGRSR
jgi:small subunit ribosomal protein S16